jgi:hypothetical protein
VAGVALYLVAVLGITALRRARRHRSATEPHQRIALAWDESVGAVRRAGVPVRDAQTQTEVAGRISDRMPDAEASIRSLAMAVQDATYAPHAPSDDAGAEALERAREVEQVANASMTRKERWQSRVDPRRLWDS